MPTRLCSVALCGGVATYRGRCSTHAQQNNRATHHNTHIYNTSRWRHTRRAVLMTHPLCACGALAHDVDHIISIEDGGDPWSMLNLQALCARCHGQKTNAEMRAR